MELMQEVKKVGGSLMVRIPKDVADKMNLQEGDTVFFEPRKHKESFFGSHPELPAYTKEKAENISKYV